MILLQCVTPASFAAKGHTTNNGGNLAEIRYTDAWKTFEATMAPCLTPQNLCGLSDREIAALRQILLQKARQNMVLPAEGKLYDELGAAKSEAEMSALMLAELEHCGPELSGTSAAAAVPRALQISQFSSVTLFRGQTWFVFQREGLFVEHVSGVQDFTPKFRALLRLPLDAKIEFERVGVRNRDGLIEIGGRVRYAKEIEKNNGFTLLINPYEDGTIPARTDLVVFR